MESNGFSMRHLLLLLVTVAAAYPAEVFDEQPIFSQGDGGYACFRIPALVVTAKGTVLAFAEGRRTNCHDDDDIDLVMRASRDNGKSWSPLRVLFDDGNQTVNQPAPVFDAKTGEVILVFCKNNQRVFVSRSRDEGGRWSAPLEITSSVKDPAWKYLGAGPGHGIQLASGRLLIPSWGDTSSGPPTWRPASWGKVQFSYAMYSDDHGRTWKRSAPMDSDTSDECMAVETAPNVVYMNMRSRQNRKRRAYAWSRDGGGTWSKVQNDSQLPEPSCQGSVLLIKSGAKNRILVAHPSNPAARTHLVVRLSEDNARTWKVSRLVTQGPGAYSDLALAPDQRILCLYEGGRYSSKDSRLVLTRFNLEWLAQGKLD